jgi:hypothetical protein
MHVPETAPHVAWLVRPGNKIRFYKRDTLELVKKFKLDFDKLQKVITQGELMFVAGGMVAEGGTDATGSRIFMVDQDNSIKMIKKCNAPEVVSLEANSKTMVFMTVGQFDLIDDTQ